jgi:hypothetical protein
VEEDQRPHAYELLNYLNKLEKQVYGKIVSDENKSDSIKLQPGSFITNSPNTSGSFSQSFENSITSDENSFDLSGHGKSMSSGEKRNIYSKDKKLKLSSKSKEFIKITSSETPTKILGVSQTFDNKVKPYTIDAKNTKLNIPPFPGVYSSLNPVSERSQANEEDNDEKDDFAVETKNNQTPRKNAHQEENLGSIFQNGQTSFISFNSSYMREDNSFVDTSFNTILNLNADINDENRASNEKLLADIQNSKLPSGYYKFRIFVPEKGELICKQHVVDLSSVKVISSTNNSLGKIFSPKKPYLQYLLESCKEEEKAEIDIDSSLKLNIAENGGARLSVQSINSSFEKSTDSKTFDLEFKDGSSYCGQVIKHGFGTFKDARGNTYEGNWHLDQKQGHGKQIFVADSHYKQNLLNDSP